MKVVWASWRVYVYLSIYLCIYSSIYLVHQYYYMLLTGDLLFSVVVDNNTIVETVNDVSTRVPIARFKEKRNDSYSSKLTSYISCLIYIPISITLYIYLTFIDTYLPSDFFYVKPFDDAIHELHPQIHLTSHEPMFQYLFQIRPNAFYRLKMRLQYIYLLWARYKVSIYLVYCVDYNCPLSIYLSI